MDPRQRLIVALDVSSSAAAHKIVAAVGDSAHAYKVGSQLYTAEGPAIVRELVSSGRKVFLDLKYHDIPNTVGAAVREAAQLGVSMLTAHASGGGKMLRAAVDAAQGNPNLLVLAVTVLTSLDDADLNMLAVRGGTLDQVLRLKHPLSARNSGAISLSSLPECVPPAAAPTTKPASSLLPKPLTPEPPTLSWGAPSPRQLIQPRRREQS